jgi:futalosine hydrolase
MNSLLAAATAMEISPFLSHHSKNHHNSDVDVLVTGIGSTATTYSLLKQMQLKRPDFIIQAGIAGSFDKNIPLGSVVVVERDTIADLSVIENKKLNTMFDLGLIKSNRNPYKKGWLINPHKDLLRDAGLKKVKAITINHITTSRQMTGFYNEKFQPSIESMEGAALHYVCLMENIPFLQIRSVSNYIGERNKAKWDIKNAVINLNNELIRFFNPKP